MIPHQIAQIAIGALIVAIGVFERGGWLTIACVVAFYGALFLFGYENVIGAMLGGILCAGLGMSAFSILFLLWNGFPR